MRARVFARVGCDIELRDTLRGYAERNAYLAVHFAEPRCACGGVQFHVLVDEDAGVAVRRCATCATSHAIGDGADFLEGAELEECACPCGCESFSIALGLSPYEGSDALRWVYLGLRCARCDQTGCYADWKNEHDDWRDYMRRA